MCGIAGSIQKEKISQDILNRCKAIMHNRGPDNFGFQTIKLNDGLSINLLHSRLSILDLNVRSNQPFIKEHVSLTFNGEIYNYLELKNFLKKKGYKFRTNSDTEVLINCYLHYGLEFTSYLEGMWALAIWDSKKEQLILSRDRFGEKPLYYTKINNKFVFGSEIKFIKSISETNFSVNEKKLMSSIYPGYKTIFSNNESFFKNIFLLEAGHNLIVKKNFEKKKYRYWRIKIRDKTKMSFNQAKEKLNLLLTESLNKKLRSDVPIGFCLSGGIDSSILASIAVKKLNLKIKTFSIIDDDKRYNELNNIQYILKDLNCDHSLIRLSKKNTLQKLKKLIQYHEKPIPTISYLVHSYISKKMNKENIKVSISGTGADELFSGYYHHFQLFLKNLNKKNSLYKENYSFWKKYIHPFIRDEELKKINFNLNPKNNFIRKIFNDNFIISKIEENSYQKNIFRNRMYNELFKEVVPVILDSDDLNSMFYSIENRSPYLDKQIFEFSSSLPEEYLISNGYQKYILREAFQDVLVDKVRLDRQKKGFNASIQSLFDFNDSEIQKILLSKKSYLYDFINISHIKKILNSKKITNEISKVLFNILNINIFLENN